MSGALLLGIITLVCVADFFIALRMARAPAARIVPGASSPDADAAIAQRRQTGRMMMAAAAVLWIIIAAMCFGLLPAHGITPIKF